MIISTIEIPIAKKTTVELHVAKLPTRIDINIPVTVYDSGIDGPTVLFMAGLHGDEINGIEIIRRFIREEYYKVQKGRVICIPILNIFGFLHFSREVPDGKDVNRSFPGSKKGSLAAKVANLLLTEILPHIDYGVDFHTGGNQINNYPQIRADYQNQKNVELAELFSAPLQIQSNTIEHSMRWAADSLGKHVLVFEGGESLRLNNFAINEGLAGSLRLLHGLGMRNSSPKQEKQTIKIDKRTWLRCTESGIWILKCKQGDHVKKGDLLGYTSGPFDDRIAKIIAPYDSVIISINYLCVVNKGDALIHLGTIEK